MMGDNTIKTIRLPGAHRTKPPWTPDLLLLSAEESKRPVADYKVQIANRQEAKGHI